MSVSSYVRFGSMAVIAAGGVALLATSIQAQQRGGTVETDRVQPVNSGEHPYRVIRDWAQLDLEARPWGGSNGVAIDLDGRSVWAVDRCSPGTTPGCADSPANPVHHFDESGNAIRSFGGGMFVWPHGIHVDRDGNVWVADARADGNKGVPSPSSVPVCTRTGRRSWCGWCCCSPRSGEGGAAGGSGRARDPDRCPRHRLGRHPAGPLDEDGGRLVDPHLRDRLVVTPFSPTEPFVSGNLSIRTDPRREDMKIAAPQAIDLDQTVFLSNGGS